MSSRTVTVTKKEVAVVTRTAQHNFVGVGTQGPEGAQGPQGPQGVPGADGGASINVFSDVDIGGHRLVYLDSAQNARYASNETLTHANKVLGITSNAAVAGDAINVIRSGEVEEGTWNLTLDVPVFLGTNGLLTQTPPEAPALFSLIVGFPITATKLFVSIREPIIF